VDSNIAAERAPIGPHLASLTQEENQRLSRQCQDILLQLRRGDCTNVQLSHLALKYTSRISDIRAFLRPRGGDVKVVHRNTATGIVTYHLVEPAAPAA
jgi:hypothetical protein